MSDLFMLPVKIFILGVTIALILTFSSMGIELPVVHNAAAMGAYDVANSTINPSIAATSGAETVIGSDVSAIGAKSNGIGYATVTYTPPQGFSGLFKFLGAANPVKPITMSAQSIANQSLATVSSSSNTVLVGGTVTISGQLRSVGAIIGTPTVTFSDGGSGGVFSNATITLADNVYNFSATYTAPASITQPSLLAPIIATVSGTGSALTAETYVLITQLPQAPLAVNGITSGSLSIVGGTGIGVATTSSGGTSTIKISNTYQGLYTTSVEMGNSTTPNLVVAQPDGTITVYEPTLLGYWGNPNQSGDNYYGSPYTVLGTFTAQGATTTNLVVGVTDVTTSDTTVPNLIVTLQDKTIDVYEPTLNGYWSNPNQSGDDYLSAPYILLSSFTG